MKTIRVSDPYAEDLAKLAELLREFSADPPQLGTVQLAIGNRGYWEEHDEWRISTVTTSRIEPVERDGKSLFRVTVRCDYELCCSTPTLERAVEFVGIYKGLITHLFGTFGWPSWAAKNRLEP
jgi:hypothetical protein